ncbi:MAG: 50S ribosomal protein L10 [Candidatus Coatesbacteria bacterium]|nr:MAG: 50S ribosomal protein L10 [Candidatus Coatesbacteria bacterium]
MPKLKRKDKEVLIEELVDRLKSASGLIVTDFHGLSVEEMTVLRKRLHKVGVLFKVVKNRLAKIAFDKAEISEQMCDVFQDRPTAIAFVDDPFVAAKELVEFLDDEDISLSFKGGMISGRMVDLDFLRDIGKVSSSEEVYGKLVSILSSPISQLAWSLKGIIQKLVLVMNEVAKVREKGEGG